MATAAPFTCRSLLAPAQQSHPRLPASIRLDLSHPKKPPADPKRRRHHAPLHPAFSAAARGRAKKIPVRDTDEPAAGVRVTDRGLAYRLDGAPFEFQYSYTEAPRARPIALREAPFLPFGPEATPRPWTGRKPLPKSRKEMPEFDSFVLPPLGKKGVKPVQSPGPFLAGMEPRYQAASREEVLGEPLTKEEVAELVKGSLKTKRQLNMGRDGLTHNMLENIHSHWKRKRVCKIRCKGVCTVDMDNVCQQLEGFLLFDPNVQPRLMLKSRVFIKVIDFDLLPAGKNGVYVNLVKQVREAFEACDLARVDCSGLNKSDCRKIGAKLKDLVPCVLLSFEFEHILMWRGRDWKSSLPPLEENNFEVTKAQEQFSGKEFNENVRHSGTVLTKIELADIATSHKNCNLDEGEQKLKGTMKSNHESDMVPSSAVEVPGLFHSTGLSGTEPSANTPSECSPINPVMDHSARSDHCPDDLEPHPGVTSIGEDLGTKRKGNEGVEGMDVLNSSEVPSYMEGVLCLLEQAIDSGRALVLTEDEFVDSDLVYQKCVAFTKSIPRELVFKHTQSKPSARRNGPDKHVRIKKHLAENRTLENKLSSSDVEEKDSSNEAIQRNSHAQKFLSDVVPQGTLRVDELAKLLA
nr:unnamed protein product [Digitaria exilis]